MGQDKLAPVRLQILEKLDVVGEYKKWGFKPISDTPSDSGWVNGFAIGRDEKNPSAGIYVGSGPKRGTYKDFASKDADSNLSFFFAAARYGGLGTADSAVAKYAADLHIPIPEQRQEAFTVLPWNGICARMIQRRYPMVSDASLKRFGCTKVRWNGHKQRGVAQQVFTFPILNETGRVGTVVLPYAGQFVLVNQGVGKPPRPAKKHTIKRSGRGWMNEDAVARLLAENRAVKIAWKVEGVSDALTVDSIIPDELRDTHIVITNAGGAHENPDKKLCGLLKGLTVYVIHDADVPGDAGAKKWIEALRATGAKVVHVRLPYVLSESNGKDVRNWIEEGHDYNDLLNLANQGEEYEAQEKVEADSEIKINGRQMADIVKEACAALEKLNDPPTMFLRDGIPTQVVHGESTTMRTMTVDQVHEQLTRATRWVKETDRGDEDVFMPRDVPKLVIVTPILKLPPVVGVTPAPIFSREGKLYLQYGYCEQTRYYNVFDSSQFVIRENPSSGEVADARDFIRSEIMVDFPFADEASVAAAFEFALRPFVRLMIDGPAPMSVIHAPTARTGKTKLIKALGMAYLGKEPSVAVWSEDDDEIRKRILALLMTGRQMFMLDNLPDRRMIDSPALASLLTGRSFEDRILGQTRIVSVPATATWVATGNNPRFTNELAGRCVSCRLVPDVEDPSTRTGFRHHNLEQWALEHRFELLEACLTIVSGWIAAGKPRGAAILGSYESWAETMSGILDVAGIPGLLANRDDFNQQSNEQRTSIGSFINAWKIVHGVMAVTPTELVKTANQSETILDILGDGGERSQQIRLGKFLISIVDRVFGGWRVVTDSRRATHSKAYRLVEARSPGEGASSTADDETFEA
jgi:hypothetical protein